MLIKGGGGRTSEKCLEDALLETEGVVIDGSAGDLWVVGAVALDDTGTSAGVPLREPAGRIDLSFSDERSPGRIGALKTLLEAWSGWRSIYGSQLKARWVPM